MFTLLYLISFSLLIFYILILTALNYPSSIEEITTILLLTSVVGLVTIYGITI